MKEKRRFKRTDLFSVLAAIGVLLVLLFESIFVFELYKLDPAVVKPYMPASLHAWLYPPEEIILIPDDPIEVVVAEPVVVETNAVAVEEIVELVVTNVPAIEEIPEVEEMITDVEPAISTETNDVPEEIEAEPVDGPVEDVEFPGEEIEAVG